MSWSAHFRPLVPSHNRFRVQADVQFYLSHRSFSISHGFRASRREPTSNFISSYRYYQYMMTSIWLDVGLRTIRDKKNPSTDVLYKEMEDFLQSFEHAEKVIRRIPPTSFARLGTYRSQLLYFGYYTDKVSSSIAYANTHAKFSKLDSAMNFPGNRCSFNII